MHCPWWLSLYFIRVVVKSFTRVAFLSPWGYIPINISLLLEDICTHLNPCPTFRWDEILQHVINIRMQRELSHWSIQSKLFVFRVLRVVQFLMTEFPPHSKLISFSSVHFKGSVCPVPTHFYVSVSLSLYLVSRVTRIVLWFEMN